jgi:hypothetical protein
MTDATAQQMAEGGWNLVWCTSEQELDTAQRHELRGLLTNGLLTPATLGDPEQRAKLDELIARVSKHPAMYAYHLIDEPNASQFPCARTAGCLLARARPAHLAYINLFPPMPPTSNSAPAALWLPPT